MLIFHLNKSFLNCSNISKNKNQLHKQFYLKITLNTKINFTPSPCPFQLASAPSLAYLQKLDRISYFWYSTYFSKITFYVFLNHSYFSIYFMFNIFYTFPKVNSWYFCLILPKNRIQIFYVFPSISKYFQVVFLRLVNHRHNLNKWP